MPISIHHEAVQSLLAEGAQIVDVLPRTEYEAEHITGAVTVPLKELNAHATAFLDKHLPVIVYCWDLQ